MQPVETPSALGPLPREFSGHSIGLRRRDGSIGDETIERGPNSILAVGKAIPSGFVCGFVTGCRGRRRLLSSGQVGDEDGRPEQEAKHGGKGSYPHSLLDCLLPVESIVWHFVGHFHAPFVSNTNHDSSRS